MYCSNEEVEVVSNSPPTIPITPKDNDQTEQKSSTFSWLRTMFGKNNPKTDKNLQINLIDNRIDSDRSTELRAMRRLVKEGVDIVQLGGFNAPGDGSPARVRRSRKTAKRPLR